MTLSECQLWSPNERERESVTIRNMNYVHPPISCYNFCTQWPTWHDKFVAQSYSSLCLSLSLSWTSSKIKFQLFAYLLLSLFLYNVIFLAFTLNFWALLSFRFCPMSLSLLHTGSCLSLFRTLFSVKLNMCSFFFLLLDSVASLRVEVGRDFSFW